MRSRLSGGYGWIIVAAVIAAIDLTAPEGETLTHSAQRAMEKHPALTIGMVTATATHLLVGHHRHYQRVDPFRAIGLLRRFTVR